MISKFLLFFLTGLIALPAYAEPIVSGEGEFKYEYQPDKLKLPEGLKIGHAHGVTRDPDGNIYMTYTSNPKSAVLRWDKDGENGKVIGGADLAKGTPHGIDCVVENGTPYLYHSNNKGMLHKTDLDCKIIWTRKGAPQPGRYSPTDTTVVGDSKDLLVADGYGSSRIFEMVTGDGKDSGKATWGGKGKGDGQFNTPHGITWDPRHNQIVVSDRENHRIQIFTADRKHVKTIQNKGTGRPVEADVWTDYLLVSNLNGPIGIFDKNNELISLIEVGKLLGAKGHKHPHDAMFLNNGDVVVGTWNPGKMSYWKRIK